MATKRGTFSSERRFLKLIDAYRAAPVFQSRGALWRRAVEVTDCDLKKLRLEFGVRNGISAQSLIYLFSQVWGETPPDALYGFDSFAGLPEDWVLSPDFTEHAGWGACPPPNLPGLKLVQGLFADSLPEFLLRHEQAIAFVHIDCDLYSSTKTVLEALHGRLNPGCVIVFDEYGPSPVYKNWERGEHLALAEVDLPVQILGRTPGGQMLALVGEEDGDDR